MTMGRRPAHLHGATSTRSGQGRLTNLGSIHTRTRRDFAGRIHRVRREFRPTRVGRGLEIGACRRPARRRAPAAGTRPGRRSIWGGVRKRPGFGRHRSVAQGQRALTRPEWKIDLLERIRAKFNDLDRALGQPATCGHCEISYLRGKVDRLHRHAASLTGRGGGFQRCSTSPSTGNEVGPDVQRGLGESRDPILLPLVPAILTGLVGLVVETDHAGPCGRGDLMPGIHPGVHIVITEEFDRFAQRRGGQQNRRPDEISHSEPRVREISPRPRPVRTDPDHGLEAVPGALNKVSYPVRHGLAAVAVLLHRRTPGHHLPGLHERIRRDPLHRGQLYPIQQPINRIRARSSRGGESLHHLRVTPQQLVVTIHHLLVIPPLIPILRQRGATKRSSLLLQRLKLSLDRFYRTSEIIQRTRSLLKLRFNRLRRRRRRSHQPIRLLRFRSHIHSR